MKLFKLAKRSQKWFVALSIITISTGLFSFWLVKRNINNKRESIAKQEAVQAKQDAITVAPTVIKTSEIEETDDQIITINNQMFLAGEQVYEIDGDQIKQIEGIQFDFGGDLPQKSQIAYSNNRFILQSNHKYWVYAKNGRKIGQLTDLKNGFISQDIQTAYFVKNGDLWSAKPDWQTIKLTDQKQLTQLGQFSNQHFVANIITLTEKVMLYRLMNQMIHVKLETGEINSIQLPANISGAPGGKIIIGELNTRPAQLLTLNIDNMQHQTYPIEGRICRPGIVWLSQNRCLVATHQRIYDYNHTQQSFAPIYRTKNNGQGLKIGTSSFNHNYVLIAENKRKPAIINLSTHKVIELPNMPLSHSEWISPETIMLVSTVPDSQYRGCWLYNLKTQVPPTRILHQPLPINTPIHHFTNQNKSLLQTGNNWILIDTKTNTSKPTTLTTKSIMPISEIEVAEIELSKTN